MKLLHQGKIYDTEKSEKLYRLQIGLVARELWRTSRGAYFRTSQGFGASVGHEIEPLLENEAMEWLENIGATEVLLENFGDRYEEA